MNKLGLFFCLGVMAISQWVQAATVIEAPQNLWYPAILTFDGPAGNENETTFRNYRLDVTFTKGTKSFKVPGYFAADGNAGETSASSGNKWRVKFTPDESGEWNYQVSFRTGTDIAVSLDPNAGTPVVTNDGETGTFTAGPHNPTAPGLYAKGMFRYVGEHYGQFGSSNEWHVKAGPGSPEDFFGYYEFDGTVDFGTRTTTTQKSDIYLQNLNGEGLHYYATHVADWVPGNPTWKGGKGKGIIGVLNYLASIGANALYMILMTETDDSDNTWPWVTRGSHLIFDVSKLDQWDIVFSHMDAVGIAPNVYFSEADNNKDLDGGDMTLEYPIYYREMIARFGHHLGIRYNIGEEPTMSSLQISNAAQRLSQLDPYNHPVGVHSSHVRADQFADYDYLLGRNYFDGAWMQLHPADNVDHLDIAHWRSRSAATGHKWLVANDEGWAITPDKTADVEKYYWRTVMAGGEGYLQYTGYSLPEVGDITLENFRLIENTLKLIIQAKNLFMLPTINPFLPQMNSEDGLVENAGGNNAPFCFAKRGELYIVYRTSATNQQTLDLTGYSGAFDVSWYDVRNGGELQLGTLATVMGGSKVNLGAAPNNNDKSWAIVIKRPDGSNSLPGISISSPANGASFIAPASFTVQVAASDVDGSIAQVELRNNGALVGTATTAPYAFDLFALPAGSYSLEAKAYDNLGATSTSVVNVSVATVSNVLPTVNIISPITGSSYTAPATVTVTASANDADGTIAKVEFRNNGILISTDLTAPFSFDLVNLAVGTYSIEAKAFDNLGATANSTISIQVNAPVGSRELVPWLEQFGQANGTKTDLAPTSWQAVRTTGTFEVRSGKLVINGAGTQAVLTTGIMDITTSPANVSLELYSAGALETNQDYVRLYKKVDGGPEVLIGEKLGNQAATVISQNGIGGATLQLVIRAYVSASDEFYHMDNLSVTGGISQPQPPTVSITSPANGATFTAPASVNLAISASDGDGSISKIELRSNGVLVGTDSLAPYAFSLTGLAVGSYVLEARAYDNSALTSNAGITISVQTGSSTNEPLPWLETFSQANGTKTNPAPTSWQAVRSTGIMEVRNGKLTINGGSAVGVLTTGVMNIANKSVTVSLDLVSQGALETNQDYIRFYKKVNGGAEVLIGEKKGNQTATVISGTAITGNTLQLVIRGFVSASDEYYYLDNLQVQGTAL